jgi:hypothetical protein
MVSSRGSSLVSTVLAIAAAAGVGTAGFYVFGGGSCNTGELLAPVTPAAASSVDGACCLGGSEIAVADATPVAAEGEACTASCEAGAMTAEHGEGKVCPITGQVIPAVAAAETETGACCATGAEACCEGETAQSCESKCAAEGEVVPAAMTEAGEHGEGKVCPITGEPIADSGK